MKVPILAFVFASMASLAAQRVLSNDDVVKMVQSGVAQDIIIRAILESPVQFELTPDHLIGFKKAGLPDEVVRSMMARNRVVNQAATEADSWAKHEALLPQPATIPGGRRNEAPPPVSSARTVPVLNSNIESGLSENRAPTSESTVKPLVSSAPKVTETDDADGWALETFRPEVALSGGINFGPNRIHKVGASGTAGVAIGILDYLAAFGSYGYHSLGSTSYLAATTSGRLHELVGGVRVSLPTRFSPYAELCGGAVRAGSSTATAGIRINASVNKAAFGGGFGINYAFNSRFGMTFNVRILKPLQLQWYGYTALGLYARF